MAGTNSAFDATVFRTNIRAAMTMGSPNATQDKVTFRWKATKTFSSEDPNANPYNWSATPTTSSQHADVIVPVAVEPLGTYAQTEYTSVGGINAERIKLTLLDLDYASIQGADFVLWGQKLFQVEYVAPPIALFSVNVHELFAVAVDL